MQYKATIHHELSTAFIFDLHDGRGLVREYVGWGKSPAKALANARQAEDRAILKATRLPASLSIELSPYRKVTVEAVGSRAPAARVVYTFRHGRYVQLGIR